MTYRESRIISESTNLTTALDAMSSNAIVSTSAIKSSNAPPQLNSQPQAVPSFHTDGHSQRRTLNFSTTPSARNNQSLRKQHKGQRRPRFADEDAVAESVGLLAK